MYGLINGRIYTIEGADWNKHPVQAMAISDDGKILRTGTDDEIKFLVKSEGGSIEDLEGKVVLPGLVDGHAHIPGTAFTELFQINLYGLFQRDETLAQIKDFVDSHEEQQVFYGSGFNIGIAQEDVNAKPYEWLDEICPHKPIYLTSYDGHCKWLNSAAMKANGIDESFVTDSCGLVGRIEESGELTGIFSDVKDLPIPDPVYTKEEQRVALTRFIKKMNSWGYTSLLSQAPSFNIDFRAYKDVEAHGDLTLRASIAQCIYEKSIEEDIKKIDALREELKSDKLKVTTAKFFMDGVLEGKTAYLKEPYKPEAGLGMDYCSSCEWDFEPLVEAFKRVGKKGYQIHIHSTGDAGVTFALDAMDEIRDIYGDRDPRHTITHLHVVDYNDLDRFAELNVIAAIQPFWHLKEPGFFEFVELPFLGKERAERVYPAKSFVKRGVRITSSGDYPISFMNDPFMGIRAGVTRNLYSEAYYGEEITNPEDPRYLLGPDERLSVKDMIEAYTINGAYEINRENEIGSLSAGKYADYIIIDADPFETDVLKLDSIKVLSTVFGGEVVF